MNFRIFLEGKSDIVVVGYPLIISKLLHEKFGNLAFLIARWFKENKFGSDAPDNWWLLATSNLRGPSLWDLTYLYKSTSSEDEYFAALKKFDLEPDNFVDLEEQRIALERQIRAKFFDDYFFKTDLIKAVMDGKIDINAYKRLSFSAAQDKLDKSVIFNDSQIIRSYPDGFKWINAGVRCQLIAKSMKNCGSAGLMSSDPDKTMLVLFDKYNNSHVMLTYSPNLKTLSSDVGVGSSEVKSKYHNYILDLSKFLNAEFNTLKTKSNYLKIKYILRNVSSDIEELPSSNDYDNYYKFSVGGHEYYSDSYSVVSYDDVKKVMDSNIVLKNNSNDIIKNIFHYMNRPILAAHGVKYIFINDFVK